MKKISVILIIAFLLACICSCGEGEKNVSGEGFPDEPVTTELSGMFDPKTAKQFEVDGLICHIPKEWDTVESFEGEDGENIDGIRAVYVNPTDDTYPVGYYVEIWDNEEKSSFNTYVSTIKDDMELSNIERIKIDGCDNGIICDHVYRDDETNVIDKKCRLLFVECGDDFLFLQMICTDPEFYDINEFDKILKSAEFEKYEKEHPYKSKETETTKAESTTTTTTKAITETTTKKRISLTTTEEKNAYKTALSYLDSTGFSRRGLIEQLEYEQYSHDASEKAVAYAEENGEVDWTNECYETAVSYLDSQSFSKNGLIEQLQYEGFTDEQINAIIDKAYK